jgi:hypothetical protein
LARVAETSPHGRIYVLIVGDGANDRRGDLAADAHYRRAMARLAANPGVAFVRWWGVAAPWRKEVRAVRAPLGPRLQILTIDQNPLAP